ACKHRLYAQRGTIRTEATVELQRGQEWAWNPTLAEGAKVDVLLLDPEGKPLPVHQVQVRRGNIGDGTLSQYFELTDHEGRCRFAHLQAVEYDLRALIEGSSVCIAERKVVPGNGEVVLRVDASRMPNARLSGRVVDARGKPVHGCEVSF